MVRVGPHPWHLMPVSSALALLTLVACEPSQPPTEPPPDAAVEVPAEQSVAGIYERSMSVHREWTYLGELAEVKRRGVLRVAMLNNAAAYFIYRGMEIGFQFELAELMAARLGVRLDVYVAQQPTDLRRLLAEKRVDVIPMGRAEAAADESVRATRPFIFANHVVVQPSSEKSITSETQLSGRVVHARRSSRYWPHLVRLAERVPDLELVAAPEEMETEDLIAAVGRGALPLTVANTNLLSLELTYRDDVRGTLTTAEAQGLVYAVSAAAPHLAARLERFIAKDYDGPDYQRIHAKYFENPKRMAELRAGETGTSGAISPYDDLAKKFGEQHGIDWRLILAQMYQESRFDPQARSWAGAIGLMQLMPNTAAELGVKGIAALHDPEQNIGAGVRYLRQLLDRFDPDLPMRQRVRFALASYNAGYYHVVDARKLAQRRGLDPDRWFGHTAKAILLLEHSRYYRKARFGYCRGSEPVAYVSRIQSKYEGFVALAPDEKSDDE